MRVHRPRGDAGAGLPDRPRSVETRPALTPPRRRVLGSEGQNLEPTRWLLLGRNEPRSQPGSLLLGARGLRPEADPLSISH